MISFIFVDFVETFRFEFYNKLLFLFIIYV